MRIFRKAPFGVCSLIGMFIVGVWGAGFGAPENSAATQTESAVVKLLIDYGDGAQLQLSLPWRDGMTVLDALAEAKSHRHGVDFRQRGTGSAAMITQIDDLANEGGRSGKNWLFFINDKLADRGAGAVPLSRGDVVLWKFQVYQYNS